MTTTRDIVIYAGEAFALSLPYAGTADRGQRAHIRTADATATVVQILTHNGATNARVLFDGTDALDLTIGGSVSAAWVVGANRVEWVYDIEDYDLSDADDVVIPYRGKVAVYGNRTRESDVTPSDQMPSGDGRYVRFDGVQGLSAGQQLQARENIGAGTGGGGGSAAWGDITGTLSAQTDLNSALALKAPLASPTLTGTPAAPTAAGGTSTTQVATTAFVAGEITTHSGATDPHGDRSFATSAVSTHAALTTGVHGLGGAALLAVGTTAGTVAAGDDARLSDARTPTAHKTSHATGGADALTAADIGAATAAQGTDDRTASGLRTATTVVAVSSATAPSSGQVLTATSSTVATWQTPSSGGGSPGGSASELQYRVDGTTFGGMAGTAWDNTNRALTVTGATLTASAPILDLSQTWNNAAVTFTAVKVNVTNTASAAASLLQDWQVGGVSTVSMTRSGVLSTAGAIRGPTGNAATPALSTTVATTTGFFFSGNEINYSLLGTARGTLGNGRFALDGDTILARDAANIFAQRNTTSAQTLRVYGTYTDASNYVRASLAATSTAVTLAAETAGTGADNVPVIINPGGTSQVEVGNGVQFTEMTAPSAPAANKVILFAQDNGAGKTQLMALFPSGAAQQVSIEP